MSVEQLTLLIDRMTQQDALRAEEMLNAIASHNWDAANSLISDWALEDLPEDGWEVVEPDGGIQESRP
jgi:hypothetical protein